MPRRTTARVVFGMAVAAASLSLAGAALAAPARPAGTGTFTTWSAAQKAAGFKLIRPGDTFGLVRAGRIRVGKCEVTGELSKRLVDASYGNPSKRLLDIQQNNSGGPCGDIGESKNLGHYQVDGVRAQLLGECGLPDLPRSCHSRDIFLFLTWTKNHVFYQAASHDEWRATIVGFARSLIPAT
jgi:hypothetical protein